MLRFQLIRFVCSNIIPAERVIEVREDGKNNFIQKYSINPFLIPDYNLNAISVAFWEMEIIIENIDIMAFNGWIDILKSLADRYSSNDIISTNTILIPLICSGNLDIIKYINLIEYINDFALNIIFRYDALDALKFILKQCEIKMRTKSQILFCRKITLLNTSYHIRKWFNKNNNIVGGYYMYDSKPSYIKLKLINFTTVEISITPLL